MTVKELLNRLLSELKDGEIYKYNIQYHLYTGGPDLDMGLVDISKIEIRHDEKIVELFFDEVW
tara:strand:+ start:3516 stop:3704 length:189 start_codon:yes stop_codon:yes gene_type:complete